MSWYGYDENGFVGDVASIGGWNDFCAWARDKGGQLATLANDGVSTDLAMLASELEKAAPAPRGDIESVRLNVVRLAGKAQGLLIISDGEEEAPDDSEGGET